LNCGPDTAENYETFSKPDLTFAVRWAYEAIERPYLEEDRNNYVGHVRRPNVTRFSHDVDFSALIVVGDASFLGVQFLDTASFDGASFARRSFFSSAPEAIASCSPPLVTPSPDTYDERESDTATEQDVPTTVKTLFDGSVSFKGAHFGGLSTFEPAVFSGVADFTGATADAEIKFGRAVFRKEVKFDRVSFGLIDLDHAFLGGNASFNGASIRSLHLSPDFVAKNTSFDFRGCLYTTLEAKASELTDHFKSFDRQPYSQLEKTLRSMGRDRDADEVYLAKRRAETKQHWDDNNWLGWFGLWIYGSVANYGVAPLRLLFYPIALLALGTAFFTRPGAATIRRDETNEAHTYSLPPTKWEALCLSIRLFLPVDIPLARRWVVTEQLISVGPTIWGLTIRPTTFATFGLRLAGWVLVPLGIAALSGLLRIQP
jgi:hypothetical protein